MSVKALVRKAVLKAVGYAEVPVGGRIGTTLEHEAVAAIEAGFRPVWYPDDPRHPCPLFWSKGEEREATPEEAAGYLEQVNVLLARSGLTFAEVGDPDGFMVKWKPKDMDIECIEDDAAECQELAHFVQEAGAAS